MKKFCYILLAELLILLILSVILVRQWRTNSNADVSITDWRSDHMEYDEETGWCIDGGLIETEDTVDILYGPFCSIEKGTYSVKIDYTCEENQNALVYAGDGKHIRLQTGLVNLSRNQNSIAYGFTAREDIDNLEILIKYNGKGRLQIRNIAVARTSVSMIRTILEAFTLFLFVDVCFLLRNYLKKHRDTFLAFVGIILLSSLPLLTQGIGKGHDLDFHLMRIEGIAREIRYGNIPVRMSSLWMDGNGYPVSVYYGDILLYIPALLRLLYVPVTSAYKLYILMINTGTAIVTCFSMIRIFKNRRVAMLTSMIYCTASYRMASIYVRSAVGEYSAMMFLPLIAMAVYRIYTESRSWKENVFYLTVGMSGLIGTHILSAEMVVFFLMFISIFLWKKTCKKVVIKTYILAVIGTCLFSAYFIVPFLDYYINVPVQINSIVQNNKQFIQESGVMLSEYFSFFRDIFSSGSVHENKRMLLTPGPALLLMLVLAVACWIKGQGNQMIRFLTVGALFTLYLSSNLFPWDYLALHYKVGNLLAQVQFPWRYIGIGVMILTLLSGTLLIQVLMETGERPTYEKILTGICVVMSCFFVSNYNDDARLVNYYDRAELSTFTVGSGEYLRQGTDRYMLSSEVYQENMKEVTVESVKGCYRKMHCIGSDKEGVIQVPVLNYRGYHVMDDDGIEYGITDSSNNLIKFSLPPNFEGHIMIDYREPWYWRMAEIFSVVSVLGACVVKKWPNISMADIKKKSI